MLVVFDVNDDLATHGTDTFLVRTPYRVGKGGIEKGTGGEVEGEASPLRTLAIMCSTLVHHLFAYPALLKLCVWSKSVKIKHWVQ